MLLNNIFKKFIQYYIKTLKKIFGTVLLKRFINIQKYTLLEITS